MQPDACPEMRDTEKRDSVTVIGVAGMSDLSLSPLCFSSSIQSEVACFAALLAFTSPASWIAPP